jgi:hypothetical protein
MMTPVLKLLASALNIVDFFTNVPVYGPFRPCCYTPSITLNYALTL